MELTAQDKLFLIKVVRDILYYKLTETEFPVYYKSKDIYKEKSGVFIKVMLKNELRAYGGVLEPEKGLIETVQDVALHACFYDTRFLPIGADEIDDISFQLAVVESYDTISDRNLIKPGVHGISIESGGKRSVILPWDMEGLEIDNEMYIQEAALKAGIDDIEKAKFKIIRVITFSEKDLK